MSITVLFCSLAVLDPRIGHTMDVLVLFSLPLSPGLKSVYCYFLVVVVVVVVIVVVAFYKVKQHRT